VPSHSLPRSGETRAGSCPKRRGARQRTLNNARRSPCRCPPPRTSISAIEDQLQPFGTRAYIDADGSALLDVGGAAAAAEAYLKGRAAAADLEGAIHVEPVKHPRAQLALVSFTKLPAAVDGGAGTGTATATSNAAGGPGAGRGAGCSVSAGSQQGRRRRRATGDAGDAAGRKRVHKEYHRHTIDALDRFLPRDPATGRYLLDTDGKGTTAAGRALTEGQKVMVLQAPKVAARFMSQQRWGADIVSQSALVSELKRCVRPGG
jgi:hypothetical protein